MNLNEGVLLKVHSGLVNRWLIGKIRKVVELPEVLMSRPKMPVVNRFEEISPVTFKDQFRELYYSELRSTQDRDFYLFCGNAKYRIDIEIFFALKAMAYLSVTSVPDRANGINMVLDDIKAELFDRTPIDVPKYTLVPVTQNQYKNYFANQVVEAMREVMFTPVEWIKCCLQLNGVDELPCSNDLLQLNLEQFDTVIHSAYMAACKDKDFMHGKKQYYRIVAAVRYIDDKNIDINSFL